jgi:hypothetical protein
MNRIEALLEHFQGRFDVLQEGMATILDERLPGIEKRLDRLESMEQDIKLMKSVLFSDTRDLEALKAIHPGIKHA